MFLSSVRTAGPGTQAEGRDWRHQMERGHQSTAPHWPTEPDEPLVFAGSSPADVEFARIFWSTAVLPPLFEPCLCPTNLCREGPPSPGQIPAHRWTPSAAHGVQEAEAKDKYHQQVRAARPTLFSSPFLIFGRPLVELWNFGNDMKGRSKSSLVLANSCADNSWVCFPVTDVICRWSLLLKPYHSNPCINAPRMYHKCTLVETKTTSIEYVITWPDSAMIPCYFLVWDML